MFQKIIDWLESNMNTCSFKEQFAINCPGCGLQRSVIALLKGDLVESFLLYPALLPVLGMFFFLALHLLIRFRNGAAILKVLFIVNMSLISIHYIIIILILS